MRVQSATSKLQADATKTEVASPIVHLWLSLDEICRYLDISKKTLYTHMSQGKIERNRENGQTFYRPANGKCRSAEVNASPCPLKEPTEAEKVDPTPAPRADAVELVTLVERLTDELRSLERERTEAIDVGHQLADQRDYCFQMFNVARRQRDEAVEISREALDERDQLADVLADVLAELKRANASVRRFHGIVDELTSSMVRIARSPLARPVRRRLIHALVTAI